MNSNKIVNSNRNRHREAIYWNTHRVYLALSSECKFSFWLGHIHEKCFHGDTVAKEHHCINATLPWEPLFFLKLQVLECFTRCNAHVSKVCLLWGRRFDFWFDDAQLHWLIHTCSPIVRSEIAIGKRFVCVSVAVRWVALLCIKRDAMHHKLQRWRSQSDCNLRIIWQVAILQASDEWSCRLFSKLLFDDANARGFDTPSSRHFDTIRLAWRNQVVLACHNATWIYTCHRCGLVSNAWTMAGLVADFMKTALRKFYAVIVLTYHCKRT